MSSARIQPSPNATSLNSPVMPQGLSLDETYPTKITSGTAQEDNYDALGTDKNKRRDMPSTLDLGPHDLHERNTTSKGKDRARDASREKPSLQISLTPSESPGDVMTDSSSHSALDEYYFSFPTPNRSPQPPSRDPVTPEIDPSVTKQANRRSSAFEPVTPVRDPGSIDRRGLIGVGDLTTPRWGNHPMMPKSGWESKEDDFVEVEVEDEDDPSSPWTIEAIEAIDGENEDSPPGQASSQLVHVPPSISPATVPLPPPPPPRTIRHRPSATEESGGEEILYQPPSLSKPKVSPPKVIPTAQEGSAMPVTRKPSLRNRTEPPAALHSRIPSNKSVASSTEHSPTTSTSVPPPTAFTTERKARKRTSDEFAMDQNGGLISKVTGASLSQVDDREEKVLRKHRSLGVGVPNAGGQRIKDRRSRGDSVGLSLASGGVHKSSSAKSDRHSRHASASSTASSRHLTDFSHLPPSPSTATIPQYLRHSNSLNTQGGFPSHHSSPNVAHSLLRGTQEGLFALDDSSTAEALRKLDGISGKSIRARSSIGSGGSRSNSRPTTPGKKTENGGWEGRDAAGNAVTKEKELRRGGSKDHLTQRPGSSRVEADLVNGEHSPSTADTQAAVVAALPSPPPNVASHPQSRKSTLPKEPNTPNSARSSFGLAKRGSASSASFVGTPTSTSRDSTSLSTATSVTTPSMAGLSNRHSAGKLRRNSVSSDVSSVHSNDLSAQRDRVAALAHPGADGVDEDSLRDIPPVPPLPKEYQPSLPSATSLVFPTLPADTNDDPDRTVMLIPHIDIPPTSPAKPQQASPISAPARGPTKKWSFSNALNIKLPGKDSHGPKSPTASPASRSTMSFGGQSRKNSLASPSPKSSTEVWSPNEMSEPRARMLMPSSSSTSLLPIPSSNSPVPSSSHSRGNRSPERLVPSRSETASSASTHGTAGPTNSTPFSPSAKRTTARKLTPSSIPFFRRSSSHIPSPGTTSPNQPSISQHLSTASISTTSTSESLTATDSASSPSARSPPSKKPSVLSLGFPSLLKSSSSRKSIHIDNPEPKVNEKEREKKPKEKKDDRDRSESRISVFGRKRGKTLSSAAMDAKPPRNVPVPLPPMQMNALPPTTVQRVASLKGEGQQTTPTTSRTRTSVAGSSQAPSSPANKASDASLRSTRQNLPTIAGSPSVGTVSTHSTSSLSSYPPSMSSSNQALATSSTTVKDTPTKIPRISGRTSATMSPQTALRTAGSLISSRRTSLHVGSDASLVDPAGSSQSSIASEFGTLENGETPTQKPAANPRHSVRMSPPHVLTKRNSIRSSPQSTSRVPRQSVAAAPPPSSSKKTGLTRDALSFTGLRKSSVVSMASSSTAPSVVTTDSQPSSRFSALSPSKSLKLLSPKISLPATRSSGSSSSAGNIAASNRQSLSTPSPAPSSLDDEELLGDEEMLAYIKRQHARRLATGAKREELEEMLKFPEPTQPVPGISPAALLRSPETSALSEYEREEVLEYESVHYYGKGSEKKPATRENRHNNHGYDDDRGDYLVINHDHLAYRYEVIDTLGKGSFGQVLRCRDHKTGESVAIKIIRNKRRFYQQALVEIKILDNLRKWDPDEKHYVIKMTEHFYFRGHLCIAMELLSINLYELIKANGFMGFTTTLIRRFTTQMLASLILMRHHRIVHCDLKPENVLLRHPAKSGIKVIDFGSSCFEHEKVYTYIQSRFYRSPEVILGLSYHMAIDMWSLGCILAELFTGFPIFPGENEQEQLACIMEVLGVPERELINRSTRKKLFFDPTGAPRPVVNSKGRRRRPGSKSLAQVLKCDDEQFVDFIAKCLNWDPDRRMKPQAALRHPFILSGRRPKLMSPAPSSSRLLSSTSSSLSSRSKPSASETPKKSQIGAPIPLTARSAARTSASASIPNTPSGTPALQGLGNSASSSHRTYRTTQTGISYHHSSRNLPSSSHGYPTTASNLS